VKAKPPKSEKQKAKSQKPKAKNLLSLQTNAVSVICGKV
jgi:hypothetical protein